MSENDSKSVLAPLVRSALGDLGRWLRRTVAFVIAALTVWIIIGSIWFPDWWSAAFFGGLLINGSFLIDALVYLFDSEVWFLFCLAGFCLVAVVAVVLLPEGCAKFFKAVERWAVLIIAVCVLGLLIDVRILYKRTDEWPAQFFKRLYGLENERPLSPPDPIQPPLDFYYLDISRVTDIYSEIEPELVEEKRILSAERKLGESAGVDAGGVSLKAEASKSREETSEFKRSESTATRKCLELMRFTLKSDLAPLLSG